MRSAHAQREDVFSRRSAILSLNSFLSPQDRLPPMLSLTQVRLVNRNQVLLVAKTKIPIQNSCKILTVYTQLW